MTVFFGGRKRGGVEEDEIISRLILLSRGLGPIFSFIDCSFEDAFGGDSQEPGTKSS